MTTTAARRQRRLRPTFTASSCCCGLLALAATTSAAPAALPVEGLEQQLKQPLAANALAALQAKEPYSFDTRARTLSILQTLRSGLHPLEVLDEALPGGEGEVGFGMEMRGWDGRPYTCAPVMDPRPSANATMDELPPLPPPTLPKTDHKLAALDNTCALLGGSAANGDEYWSYEWCHRNEIRQFHLGPPTVEGGENTRDPNWSLGKFVGTEVRYTTEAKKKRLGRRKSKFPEEGEGEDVASPELQPEYGARRIDHIVDRFEGGQRCDETNEGRRSAVRFYCCADPAALPEDVQELLKGMKPVPYAVAQLAAIRETSVCNYTLTVCTPLLCDATADPAAAAAAAAGGVAPLTGAAAKSPVLRLLEPLSQFCITRHEGYWSYEFCYKRGVRQFHNVAVRDPKGRVTSRVDSEYVIGKEHPQYGEDFREEDHIVQGEGDADATHFAMEYPGGTECDLTGRQRSTTVHFICGEGTDQFISVKEDRSCHYKVVIATPRLCKHPAFRKQLPSARTVRCTPVGGGQGQGQQQEATAAGGVKGKLDDAMERLIKRFN